MFEDVIEVLLQKKAALRDELEREFTERSGKIDSMLALAGYVEPVAEPEKTEDTDKENTVSEQEAAVNPYLL